MEVNILMPVYNTRPSWIAQAINSIEDQTFENWTLIILDDCSTSKETISFLDSIKQPKIKVKKSDRNMGCDSIRVLGRKFLDDDCKFVFFMDSDDIMMPQRIEKQTSFLNKNKDIGIVGGQMQYFPDRSGPFVNSESTSISNPLTAHPYNVNLFLFSSHWVINNPSTAMRREVLDNFDFEYMQQIHKDLEIDTNVFGDAIFYCISALNGIKIRNLNDVILLYRSSSHQITNTIHHNPSMGGGLAKHKKLRNRLLRDSVDVSKQK